MDVYVDIGVSDRCMECVDGRRGGVAEAVYGAHLAHVHKLSHIFLPALVRVISQHQSFVSLLDDAAARIPRHSQD